MSKTETRWEQLTEQISVEDGDLALLYNVMYGPLFSRGIDIGREVESKLTRYQALERELEKLRTRRDDAALDAIMTKELEQAMVRKDTWPTFLSALADDRGLSTGFYTEIGIAPGTENAPVMAAIILRERYDIDAGFRTINAMDELDPFELEILQTQGWRLPGVRISYFGSDLPFSS